MVAAQTGSILSILCSRMPDRSFPLTLHRGLVGHLRWLFAVRAGSSSRMRQTNEAKSPVSSLNVLEGTLGLILQAPP